MKKTRTADKICVLGAGLWGAALADHLARRGYPVRLWEIFKDAANHLQKTRRHPHMPDFRLAPGVRVDSDMGDCLDGAGMVLMVVPSAFVRRTARAVRPLLEAARRKPTFVNASKGVEPGSLRTMGEAILEEVPTLEDHLFTLSGPSFAKEVARGVPTRLVLAGPSGPRASAALRALSGGAIRVEHSPDRVGVELGGSLKNVLAIGCGVLDGVGAGANTKAAFIVAGMREMGALIERLGGRRETIFGLAGLGDMIATGSSAQSRNRTLGEKLGSGRTLAKALREIPTVAEGVESALSAHTLAKAGGLKCPLVEAVYRVVHRGAPARTVVKALGF